MAWSSDDQSPSLAPAASSGVNYAAALNSAAYYNPLSGGSSSTGMAPVAGGGGQPSYADRLNAANPEQKKQTTSQALAKSADRVITPWETRETWNRSKATSADRTQFARGYLTKNSTEPGGTMLRQGVGTSIDRLHPVFAQRLSLAVQQARKEGMPVGIRSAYRPPGFGVGGMRDKRQSLHAYGLSVDVSGIGRPGSDTAKRWAEIAQEHGLYNPWASNPKEWNHWQLVPNRVASELPGLRDTITAQGPGDLNAMWAASGVDPGEMVNRPEMMAARIPTPRARPAPAGFDTGRLDAATAYADEPMRTQAPFDAVMADVPTPRQRPQQPSPQPAQAAAPSAGGYTVQRGDTLSAIAQRELGDPNRWREIAQANGIRDPRRLMPGQQLVIPAAATRTVDIPQPRVRPRIATGPVGPTTARGVLEMGPRRRPGGAPDAGRVPDPRMRPASAIAQADDIDRMTEVDEAGNYVLPQNVGGARPEGQVRFQSRIAGRPERPGALPPAARAAAVEGMEQFGPGNRSGRVAFDTYRPRESYGPGNEGGRIRFDSVTAMRQFQQEMEADRLAQGSRDLAEEEGQRRAEMEAMAPPYRAPARATMGQRFDDAAGPESTVDQVRSLPDLNRWTFPTITGNGTVESGSTGGEFFSRPPPPAAPVGSDMSGRFDEAFAVGGPGVIMDLPSAYAGRNAPPTITQPAGPPSFVSPGGIRIWAAR